MSAGIAPAPLALARYSRIHVTRSVAAGTVGHLSFAKNAGSGFTSNSSSTTATSRIDYFCVEKA